MLALFLLVSPAAAAQQDPPQVEIDFQVAPGSRFDRVPAQRDGARPLVIKHLSTLGASYFGFLRWSAAAPGAAGSATPRLTVRLEEAPRGAGKDKVLRFKAHADGREFDLRPLEGVVYEWHRLDLPADAAGLARDVGHELDRLFALDNFRRELHERFLRAVPLATAVGADAQDRRIFVPLRWETLQADPDSVLRVQFEVRGATPRQGTMKISQVQKRSRDPHRGGIQGAISLLDCAPLLLRDWTDEVPALMKPEGLIRPRVFMETYVPRGGLPVEDGLVTRLGGGSQ
ncbi:MAG TPA: hypothetical protein VJ885_16670 [Thermoanaerobaculia bacterium]|nr:hypothetical protein [Thermoanaerobaculia bacterium]